MVLPTLQSYSSAKYLTTPQHIMQRKQEVETEKKDERAQIRLNSAHSKWASPISGTLSEEALRIEQEKQEKSKRLEQRRSHLSAILEAEKNKFQNEITSNRQSSRESIPDMKTHADSLRSTHEKEHQVIADEKLYEYGTTNNPDLHSIEQQKLKNFEPEYGSEQFNEKYLVHQEDEEELSQYLDEYDRQDEERQTGRQKRIAQLKIILQQQMNEIQQKEKESELLKQEEEHLLTEQSQLEQYQEERKQMEKRYVQQDYSRQLLRQHKAKLHKRAKEIQEELELDIKILAFIAHTDDETRLEKLKRDALNMLKQFEQQMKLEKEKEQKLDAMFQEEAAKQWSQFEQQWNHEKESREKSMYQLMDQTQEQLRKELQILKEQQEETYEKQQILVKDMEQARKYDLIEKQKQAKEREEKKQRLIIQQERTQSPLEYEKQDDIQRDHNKPTDLLVQKQKDVTTVEPKFYGRRRVNWK